MAKQNIEFMDTEKNLLKVVTLKNNETQRGLAKTWTDPNDRPARNNGDDMGLLGTGKNMEHGAARRMRGELEHVLQGHHLVSSAPPN